jgi:sortase family protein
MSTRRLIARVAHAAARLPAHTPRRLAVLLLAAAAVTTAGGMTASALTSPPDTPSRPAPPAHERDLVSIGLGRSAPVRIVIPRLGVDAQIVPLGLERGELRLPADARQAGWYRRGTSPGEPGSAVIVGRAGPPEGGHPIFAGLDRLTPGDAVQVVRADGATASFAVERVETASGEAGLHDPGGEVQLRLVAAYGTDPPADHQIVVFAAFRP